MADSSHQLTLLGWSQFFADQVKSLGASGLVPGRVAADYGSELDVMRCEGVDLVSRRDSAAAESPAAVGDWVLLAGGPEPAVRQVLERKGAVMRKAPDPRKAVQILAANVERLLITTSLGPDLNPRRVERMLTVAYQAHAVPAIVLTKADLGDTSAALAELAAVGVGVPVIACSCITGAGMDELLALLPQGQTGALIGSSGVGKSTLVNHSLGEERLRHGDVHATGQGRHTTTRRDLVLLPDGGVIIDTPGLRQLQLWTGEDALADVFADIESIAAGCRFRDCLHATEPGCAVLAAIDRGQLAEARLRSYRKLQRELRSVELRADARLRKQEARTWAARAREGRLRAEAKQ